jgi:8-amino-7-oxononanoate synthase
VIDFTSALYLGLEHPQGKLPAWTRLTTGKPAALENPPGARQLETAFAALAGCEHAMTGPSTLHLFRDLFEILERRSVAVFVDRCAYPIARWGTEAAAAKGTPVRPFRRHDARHLAALAAACGNRSPVAVTDGYCPGCAIHPPLAEYLDVVRERDGWLVVDDTQSLGIFGESPHDYPPWGKGGGGCLKYSGLRHERIVLISSAAKSFGAPLALVAGSAELIAAFESESSSRVHCSPPAAPVIAAASRALRINQVCGDALRRQLAKRVGQFRRGLARIGITAPVSWFPVQRLRSANAAAVQRVHRRLLERGIRAVIHRPSAHGGSISFIVTARHSPGDIARATEVLAECWPREYAGLERMRAG